MKPLPLVGLTIVGLMHAAVARAEIGEPSRGGQLFRACAACHSVQPDRNMTGPSLAGVWAGERARSRASTAIRQP
jgi:cytochrome c